MIAFRRLHGLGNDYVFLHERDLDGRSFVDGRSFDAFDLERAVRVISDRHRGVGGDGVISVAALEAPESGMPPRIRMRMWNADGTPGGMCGNGVRGAVRFAIEEELAEVGAAGLVVEIGDREVRCRVVERSPVFRVSADMGPALFEWASVPFHPSRPLSAGPSLLPLEDLDAVGPAGDAAAVREATRSMAGWSVASMGNPHLVLVASDVKAFEACPLASIGPALEHAEAFPERTNVHVALVESARRLRLRTWERGTGGTLACGSGACAAFAILQRAGLVGDAVEAILEGGELSLAHGASGRIEMTGPSESCCSGTVDLASLLAGDARRPAAATPRVEIELAAEGAS